MPNQPTTPAGGSHNPRNNPRPHPKPTRRHPSQETGSFSAAPYLTGPAAVLPPDDDPAVAGCSYPSGHDAASQEAAARAAYEQYAAAVSQPHPQAANHPQYGSRYQQQGGYAGYAPAGANPRVMPAQKTEGQMTPYDDMGRYKKKGKKKSGIVSAIVAVVILAVIGVGVYLYLNPPTYNVTVNGMTRTVHDGATVGDIINEGIVSPKPGNLLAVDGEVLEEGGGTPFTGTINGSEFTDAATALHKGDTLQIEDGADATEDYETETVESEPGHQELGDGAIHVYVPGETGQVEKRTGKVSGKTVEETVREGRDNIYLKYNADTKGEKVVALTFDDGPIGTTPELLDVLKQYGVKATFFTIGDQIFDKTDFSEVVKRAADEGHQICTHSYDHASGSGRGVDMTRMSADEQIAEVQKGQDAITQATGKEASKIFRSPGGNYHDEIIWTLQPYVTGEIGWNVDTEDWRRPGAEAIAQRLLSVKPGDVVLMHDGGGDRSQTIEALKIALPQLVEEGYKFVTIDQLIAYDDVEALAKDLQDAAAA
ncbi:polysaccharide deacetylase family protein [Adlercreutzia muris]|uniref:Polysaccharide deacetylase family protein n=2 Tax=Adlercreutzia TaxID=447020 RepID=A0A7C8FWX1_9ACTN|nr:polysaccharide deacetylase family protein [Adlercreutzia muris]KAB1648517.1 polysaccharide deacetylase family protein [Adlercreutzia muris]MCR2029159.1 polysaccharide deacetylase family protein [Adlercreutzia muris]MCU7584865.1 polysaccharide deacetylase family protein [Adlercreutzia muris]